MAQVRVGDSGACSGALVNARWVLSAAACFSGEGELVTSGEAPQGTTVRVGRPDSAGAAVQVVAATRLVVLGEDRDLVLVRLARRVGIVPAVSVSGSGAAVGEPVQIAGWGRTETEWAPQELGAAAFTVAEVGDATARLSSVQGSVCQGDAGAPVVRQAGGGLEVVGVVSSSWQGGCVQETETRTDVVMTRIDDFKTAIGELIREPVAGDVSGDGKADLSAFYRYEDDPDVAGTDINSGLWVFTDLARAVDPRRVFRVGQAVVDWDRTIPLMGDFDDDGRSEFIALSRAPSDDSATSGVVSLGFVDDVTTAKGQGFTPVRLWASGKEGWAFSRMQAVTGDFTGDGVCDIAVLYKYADGSARAGQTALWLFDEVMNKDKGPVQMWIQPETTWDGEHTKLLAGDFTGDGRSDLVGIYDRYTSASDTDGETQVRLLDEVSTAEYSARTVWGWLDSEGSGWVWDRITPVAGDFTGDGKSDIAVLYKYVAAGVDYQSGLWVFGDLPAGEDPVFTWGVKDTVLGWDRTRLVAGDFTGDGRGDLVTAYDYYSSSTDTDGETRLYLEDTVTAEGFSMTRVWDWTEAEGNGWIWNKLRFVS